MKRLRKFNENEPEMYTLSGLDSSGVLIHPILHHTWILANIFKPVLEEDINIGLYIKQEFKVKNVEYCGMTITSSPIE